MKIFRSLTITHGKSYWVVHDKIVLTPFTDIVLDSFASHESEFQGTSRRSEDIKNL